MANQFCYLHQQKKKKKKKKTKGNVQIGAVGLSAAAKANKTASRRPQRTRVMLSTVDSKKQV